MTKGELVEILAPLPDDYEVQVGIAPGDVSTTHKLLEGKRADFTISFVFPSQAKARPIVLLTIVA